MLLIALFNLPIWSGSSYSLYSLVLSDAGMGAFRAGGVSAGMTAILIIASSALLAIAGILGSYARICGILGVAGMVLLTLIMMTAPSLAGGFGLDGYILWGAVVAAIVLQVVARISKPAATTASEAGKEHPKEEATSQPSSLQQQSSP
ncbi:MAG: hypothetical protein NXY59_00415 [Aigarchaeota archaeon]|nr:hypothetical protein [Candidatus Pelearchaeum maunauluense]